MQNRFKELEEEDEEFPDMTIDSDDEEELECKICYEDEQAVMYGEDQRVNRKRVTINEDPEIKYIEEEELIVRDRDGEFDFEKLSKEIDEFVGSIELLEKELEICAVANRKVRITVDSGAAESVSPVDFFEEFMLDPVKPGKQMRLVNASGGNIPHWGKRVVKVVSPF